MKNLNEVLEFKAIMDKIYRFKEKFNPNLVANLSKEAHDIYMIKNSITETLLKKLNEEDITISKINGFIIKNIKENKEKLQETKNLMDRDYIQRSIDAWKSFLS